MDKPIVKKKAGRISPTPMGEYDDTTTYRRLDWVFYGGTSYICKKNDTFGINPSNSERWQKIFDAGSNITLEDIEAMLVDWTADKALKDGNGNIISSTYAKKDLVGVEYDIISNTTNLEFGCPDTNFERTEIIAGQANSVKEAIEKSSSKLSDRIIELYQLIKSSINLPVVSKTANGLAPKLPNETTTTKYLRQDGTWSVPPDNNTTYSAATTSANGLMTSTMVTKLNGIATGANKVSITNSLTATTAGTALDATQGKVLNDKVGKIKVYVGTDNKLHFTNGAGADSVIPFSYLDLSKIRFIGYKNTSTRGTYLDFEWTADKDCFVIINLYTKCTNAGNFFGNGTEPYTNAKVSVWVKINDIPRNTELTILSGVKNNDLTADAGGSNKHACGVFKVNTGDHIFVKLHASGGDYTYSCAYLYALG